MDFLRQKAKADDDEYEKTSLSLEMRNSPRNSNNQYNSVSKERDRFRLVLAPHKNKRSVVQHVDTAQMTVLGPAKLKGYQSIGLKENAPNKSNR